jgi:hypothetical protein
LNGAVAFEYTTIDNMQFHVAMKSFDFVSSNKVTPMSLVTECTNENAIEIAKALLKSIPNLRLISSDDRKDIDDLLSVALRKSVLAIIDLLCEMNFDFNLYFNKYSLAAPECPSLCNNILQNMKIPTLKKLCRLEIRHCIGAVNVCHSLHKPMNCYDHGNCLPIIKPKLFIKHLEMLSLPKSLISYLTFNF